jgi:hypothetical protein
VIWNDLRPQRVSALYMGKHAAAIDLKAMPGQNRWADGNGCLTSNWARNRFSPSMALGRHATACPALFSCFRNIGVATALQFTAQGESQWQDVCS